MLRRALIFMVLMVIWVILSGKLDDPNYWIMGVISCLLVTWISGDLWLSDHQHSSGRILMEAGRFFFTYVPWLMWEVALANLHVLRLALSPSGIKEVEPRILRYQTYLKGDFARFVFANSITLTPERSPSARKATSSTSTPSAKPP